MHRFLKLLGVISHQRFLKALLHTRVAASVEHKKLIFALKPACVVDIGANRGQFALLCRGLFPDIEIFSFEPLQEAVDTFRNVFKGDTKVHLFPYAIGTHTGTTIIHVSERDDSSSLLPIGQQAEIFPGTDEKETRQIEIRPLYELLNKSQLTAPALMKIDVQGYELNVLKGCGDLLDSFAYVYVECSFEELYAGQALASDVINFFHERGFVLQGIYNVYYAPSGLAIQGDFLFRRK